MAYNKTITPNLVVYCFPAEGGGTIRKNSHFVSSAIHNQIGITIIQNAGAFLHNSHKINDIALIYLAIISEMCYN